MGDIWGAFQVTLLRPLLDDATTSLSPATMASCGRPHPPLGAALQAMHHAGVCSSGCRARGWVGLMTSAR